MADIFVNYRHEDGQSAARLYEWLDEEFDTFMDTEMQSGDSISGTIRDELRNTRVFLAVIGKEWITSENLKRLHDENDWIRREFLEVLGRKDVLVIPILVDDKVKMPSASLLPAPLAPFTDLLARRLSFDSWKEDVENLKELVRRRLGKGRPPKDAKVSMPSDMPFLCDRNEQEYGLMQLAANIQNTRSLVCVLHGHKWEAHSKFLSRLQQLGLLNGLLDAGAAGVGLELLEWNSTLAGGGQFAELIRYAIKSGVMHNPRSTDAELTTFLRNPGRPMVLTMQVTGSDLQQFGPDTLGRLTQAWNQLIAGLGAVPANSLIFWINVAYEESPSPLAWQSLPVLEKLGPLTDGHIQTWLERAEVKGFVAGRSTDILNLTDDPHFYISRGQIHMQKFADAVNTLLHS